MPIKAPNQTTDAAKMLLRLPPTLHKAIKKKAQAVHLSVNELAVRALVDAVNPEYTIKTLIKRLEDKDVI